MVENTLEFRWTVAVQSGLYAMFRDDPNVIVAGNCTWRPVKDRSDIRVVPDTMVIFGRPKGIRDCYRQWEEGNIAPQVVFQIPSHNDRAAEILKFRLCEEYGVEEYYICEPAYCELTGWSRRGDRLEPIPRIDDWLSPHLRVRFHFDPTGDLKIETCDGRPLWTNWNEQGAIARE